MTRIKIGGIMQNDHLARISVKSVLDRTDSSPSVDRRQGANSAAAVVLQSFAAAGINIQFIVQCVDQEQDDHLVVCVDRDDLEHALDIACHIEQELRAKVVSHDPSAASVGIFGPDFRERPGIAGTFFAALAASGIYPQAISTSISTCTVIIAADRLRDALAAIKRTFELPFSD